MSIYLPLLFAVGGLLLYALADGKASRVGEIAFGCGLLVFLFQLAGKSVDLLR